MDIQGEVIAIGSDHAGYELKNAVIKHLDDIGVKYINLGCLDGSSCDYPVVAREVCAKITDGTVKLAILVCGTGIGISIAANKIKGIRAAVCTDAYTAKYTRLHNNANVLCLGGRVTGPGVAEEMVDIFLSTDFEGGRHERRVSLIEN